MFEQLPGVVLDAFPALRGVTTPAEPQATCADCAMRPRPGADARRPTFVAPAACCTYQPELPNWLVGRALLRGGRSKAAMVQRLADPVGRLPGGVFAGRKRAAKLASQGGEVFGNDAANTCPFWRDEPGTNCQIHADRNGVCRTWFCKPIDGRRGQAVYDAAKLVFSAVEDVLARAVMKGKPPKPSAPTHVWERWYRKCAERLESVQPEVLAQDEQLCGFVDDLLVAVELRDRPMPDVLTPRLNGWFEEGDGWVLAAHHRYDLVEAPSWIFQLFASFDGVRTWRQAQRHAEQELGKAVPDQLVLWLYRKGLLDAPEDLPWKPGVTQL